MEMNDTEMEIDMNELNVNEIDMNVNEIDMNEMDTENYTNIDLDTDSEPDMKEKALQILRNKKAIVVAGGGVLGVGHSGAIKRLVDLGLDLKSFTSVSGSSVGSLLAMTIACGADINYIIDKMNSINFMKLKNHKSLLCDAFYLLKSFGMHKMTYVRELVSEILVDLVGNKDITFKELYEKTGVWLTITYLSFNYERTIFADHIYEPDSLVREAVIKSSAIPVFYEGYFQKKGKKKELIVDGGTMLNFPMKIPFLQGYSYQKILGLKFITSDQKPNVKDEGQPGTEEEWTDSPRNIISYLNNLVQILRNQAMKVHVKENDWKNTVKINVGNLTSTDFQMTEDEKDWLFMQGKIGVDKYVEELSELLREEKY